MRWAAPLFLVGCNQVFGLDRTYLFDAGSGSGSGSQGVIDAPFACPLSGPPVFSSVVRLWSARGCFDYSTSLTGIAAAECYDNGDIELGPIDGALDAGPGLPPRSAFDQPRLAPEGDELFLHAAGNPHELRVYHFDGTTWLQTGTLPKPTNSDFTASTPSSGPDRRVLLNDGQTVYEYANTGTGWVDIQRSYSVGEATDFMVAELRRMDLSPDGLRLVFYGTHAGTYGAFYSERPTTAARFGPATLLQGAPPPPYGDPFMTADCGRLYFAQDNAMLYAIEQL